MDALSFAEYSRYYDLLYRDKNYQTEVDFTQEKLAAFGITKGNILEWGSGTGKHGRLLAEKGYNIHGIEKSPEMVKVAELAKGFSCEVGDVTAWRNNNKYDAIISLFHVVSYLTSNKQITDAFSNASHLLKSGGIFLFDFWYTPAVHFQHPTVRVKKITNDILNITRIAEPEIHHNTNTVNVNYSILINDLTNNNFTQIIEKHSMRHFSLPEIDLLSNFHGFERVYSGEFLTDRNPSIDTWAICVILQKI